MAGVPWHRRGERPWGVLLFLVVLLLSPALIILGDRQRELFLMSVLIAVGWEVTVNRGKGGGGCVV